MDVVHYNPYQIYLNGIQIILKINQMFFECPSFSLIDKFLVLKQNQKIMVYEIENKQKTIKLFGGIFVYNNKDNCYLLIDGQKYSLCTELTLNKKQRENNLLEIRLIEIKPIINFECMFEKCVS